MANKDMLIRVNADTKNYDANLAKATKTLDQFKKNNLSLGGIANQATSALTSMATSVMGVTAAMGAAYKVISSMVSINKQFEQSSANLAAVMGTSKDQITDLTQQAKTLGATTQYTANQILELQANLARLGFNQEEILNSTKSVQAMATAMGADLGEAANLAGAALRGFGMNATEMERVASVLSVGTTKSALSFEKLATALPIVQTAAAKTGFTIEDTVAMLGKLTDNGINAASAATQLRKILNDSTTAGTKLANALGGPVKSFDELVLALDKASRSGQNHADSVALVNSKNATALDILRDMSVQREVDVNGVKKQTSALQDLRESITDCAEGMRGMQDEQLDTLQGSITILGSAWEGLMLTFSESNGVIKSVVDGLTALLSAWTSWRNRNAGGDAAVKEYELGMTEEQRKGVQETIKAYKAGGATDEQIVEQFTKEKTALEGNRDAARELYDRYYKIVKMPFDKQTAELEKWKADFKEIFGRDTLGRWKESLDYILRQVAGMNDQIAVKNFGISTLSPAAPNKPTDGEVGGDEDNVKLLRAQYEAKIKEQVAALDRMSMNEEDYESKVYEIKKTYLQMIADLYQEETVEKARALAAISQLEIQHQATMMRLANKGGKGSNDTKDKDTFNPSGPYRSPLEQMKQSIAIQQADKAAGLDETTMKNLLGVTIQKVIDGLDLDFSKVLAQMAEGADIPNSTWQELADKINEKLKELNLDPIKLNVQTGGVETLNKEVKATTDHVAGAAQAFEALGNAMGQIEDPGAKVAGLIANAIASIASGYGQAVAQAGNGSAGGPWGWIAFAISGLATMISTIAAVKSATAGSYAQGGIIPGNSFSGDNQIGVLPDGNTIGVNAGELILSKSQQSNLAGQLSGGATQTVMVEGRISGKDILLSANNTNRAAGGSRGYYTQVK